MRKRKNLAKALQTMLQEAEIELRKRGGSPSRVLAMSVLRALAHAANSRRAQRSNWSVNDQVAWQVSIRSIFFWLAKIADEALELPAAKASAREEPAEDSGHEEEEAEKQEEKRPVKVDEPILLTVPMKPSPFPRFQKEKGCWQCGVEDHKRELCPRPKTYDYCYRCGKRGYRTNTCPNPSCIMVCQDPSNTCTRISRLVK